MVGRINYTEFDYCLFTRADLRDLRPDVKQAFGDVMTSLTQGQIEELNIKLIGLTTKSAIRDFVIGTANSGKPLLPSPNTGSDNTADTLGL